MTWPEALRQCGVLAACVCIGCLLGVGIAAQSQPPSPSRGPRESAPPNQQTQANQQQASPAIGSVERPAVVVIAKSPEESAQEQRNRDQQATTNRWIVGLTGAVAVFTLGLVVVGWLQWQTYQSTLETARIVERAYLSISADSPGVRLLSGADMTVHVTNYGKTPIRITDLEFRAFTVRRETEPLLPTEPDYVGRVTNFKMWQSRAFIVPNERLSASVHLIIDRPSSAPTSLEVGGKDVLFLLAFCDYIDVFSQRHRLGWARRYDPEIGWRSEPGNRFMPGLNNLESVGSESYNYDRPRRKGEGRDWDEPA